MSIISSKQAKKHRLVDFIYVFFALIVVLLVVMPSTVNISNSISAAFEGLERTYFGVSASSDASFASDLQYWDAKCSHGWTSNSRCENIASRAQSCIFNADSVYCSQYDKYLQQFRIRNTQRINL